MQRDKAFYETNVTPHLGKGPYVLTGLSALVYSGLSSWEDFMPNVLHKDSQLPNVTLFGLVSYLYDPNLDTTHYCRPLAFAPMVYCPTRERALVENIKFNLVNVDEGAFVESMLSYVKYYSEDLDKLKEVAEFFQVPYNKVEYWIEEALDYDAEGV